jgi:hypothetical protein
MGNIKENNYDAKVTLPDFEPLKGTQFERYIQLINRYSDLSDWENSKRLMVLTKYYLPEFEFRATDDNGVKWEVQNNELVEYVK